MKSSVFQTWLAGKLTNYLSQELNSEVRIGKVDIDFFDQITLKEVYLEDQHGDTLLYTPQMSCQLGVMSLKKNYFDIKKVEMLKPVIAARKYAEDEVWNYQFLEDYFSGDEEEKDTTPSDLELRVRKISIVEARIIYDNEHKSYSEYGVDFDHLCLGNMYVELSSFRQQNDTSSFRIDKIELIDCSGFNLETLEADVTFSDQFLRFDSLLIRSNDTRVNSPVLQFSFSDFEDFDDFEEKVLIRSTLNSCIVDLDDIAFFAPELEGIDRTVYLDGQFRGTVEDFRLRNTELRFSEQSYIKGNFDFIGITDFENVFIDARVSELSTNREEIESIKLPPFDGEDYVEIPGRYSRFGEIKASGHFTGSPTDFVSYGEFVTDVGVIKTDIRFYIDTADNYFHYAGDLLANDFRAGYFYEIPDMGNVSLDLKLKATGLTFDDFIGEVEGDITDLQYKGYTYHGISLDGKLNADFYKGKMVMNDPNMGIVFDGTINYSDKIPEYNFQIEIDEARLPRVNLIDRDSSSVLSVDIAASGRGTNLENFTGAIYLNDLVYKEKSRYTGRDSTYKLDTLSLTAERPKNDSTILTLHTSIVDAEVHGEYHFAELPNAFLSVISEVMPALFDDQVVKLKNDQQFSYKVEIKDFDLITELFVPDFSMSPHVVLSGRIDSENNIFVLRSNKIEEINWGGRIFTELKFSAKNTVDFLAVDARAEQISLDSALFFNNFEGDVNLFQNRLATKFEWHDDPDQAGDTLHYGIVTGDGVIHSPSEFEYFIEPSEVKVESGIWYLSESARIAVDGSRIQIDEFRATNTDQLIAFDGVVSESAQDRLNLDIENFDIANLNVLINDPEVRLKGVLSAEGQVWNVYNDLKFRANAELDSFHVNKEYLGEFDLLSEWDNTLKVIRTQGILQRADLKSIEFMGDYYTERKKNNIDYILKLRETNLVFLNAFLPDDISNLQGLATGEIKITGEPQAPDLKGSVMFNNGAVKINMLNTIYYFGGKLNLTESMISFDSIPFADLKGNLGYARGKFMHEEFENFNLDCELEFKKLLVLNTTEDMNPQYYGRAYATGMVDVFASAGDMDIRVDVKTEKGTKIVLPLYGAGDEQISDFVRFINTGDTTAHLEQKVDLTGISMDFNFDVTPDAEVFIVFDKVAGDMMRGKGSGRINMVITPLGEFNMYGQYVVEQGEYLFTLMNVINKRFSVKKGSTISWYGDPEAAELDIKAVYKVQTSMYEVMPYDIAAQYKGNVEVECIMVLKGNLMKPSITFDITVPRGDENIKSALTIIKATEEELTRQFFALMAINKFLPLSSSIVSTGSNVGTGVKATTSELLSSQLSNWLSQISDEVDIGVNYRPGDEISNEEIAVAFSTQLFNDRVNVATNVGVSHGQSSTNQNPNQLIGDFNVEYVINEEGTFRVRGFNESNEFDITNTSQAPFTQGVGVYYTEEFDKFSELKIIQTIKSWFNNEEEEEEEEEEEK